MNSIESSQIDSIGYDEETHILYIKFKNETVYRYFDVDPETYHVLLAAESPGSYFSRNVRTIYTYEKVEFEEHFENNDHVINVY